MPKEVKEKQERKPRHTSWMVTAPYQHWPTRPELKDGVTYIKGVLETAPTTGYVHWQTTMCTEQYTTKRMSKLYPHCHIEAREGSFEQARKYCTYGKGLTPPDITGTLGTCYELGTPPRPGARTDIEEISKAFLTRGWEGVSDSAIIKYHRGLEKLKQVRYKKKVLEKVVVWYWGESGCGKTHRAFEEGGLGAYSVPARGGWFDNYQGEVNLIIDEYDGTSFTISEFIRLLDKYPQQVPIKGGFVNLEATHIWITSHGDPRSYFPANRWPEVQRRVQRIEKMSKESTLVGLPGSIITPATS